MASKFPFKYSECFKEKAIERLPERLIVKEKNNPEILLIARLLSGAITLTHVDSNRKIRQSENYFSVDLKGYSQQWDKRFPSLIGDSYSIEKFSEFVEKNKVKNKAFYKNILSELSYFFFYQRKGVHSTAFVFLYRALEHISYAFPLIYVSKTDDFSRTFRFLKDLMSGDKSAGELGFFKKFISTVYKDDPICESSVDFHILANSEEQQKSMFNLLKELCKGDMISESTESPRILSIKYMEIGSFIITVRNRFFHYMNGGAKNIESSNLEDVDQFFSIINKNCMYWFATMFLAVISQSANDFEANRIVVIQKK